MKALPARPLSVSAVSAARLLAWLLLPVLLVVGMGVRAADTPEFMGEMEYCYPDQNSCHYASLQAAEAAMRADSVYGDLLHLISTQAASQYSYKDYYKYGVDYQEPKTKYVTYSVGGWYAQPCTNTNPYSNAGCDSAEDAIQEWNSSQGSFNGCQRMPVRVMGEYIEPFFE